MAHKTIEELDLIAKKELEKIQGKELTNKDRMAIPQMEMPSREPKERSRQMSEVALGYTETQAVVENSNLHKASQAIKERYKAFLIVYI